MTVMVAVAASFAINNWKDAEADALNHPERAIPSGRISKDRALFLALLLGGAAVILALPLGVWPTLIVVTNLLFSFLYSLYLKGTLLLGNVTIAYLNGSILLFGGFVTGFPSPLLWVISALVFLFTIPQEVLYSLPDRRGDRLYGSRTTAVRLGQRKSLSLLKFLLIVHSVIVVLLSALYLKLPQTRFIVASLHLLPLAFLLFHLREPTTSKIIRQGGLLITFIRLGMMAIVVYLGSLSGAAVVQGSALLTRLGVG